MPHRRRGRPAPVGTDDRAAPSILRLRAYSLPGLGLGKAVGGRMLFNRM
jgi:hypothetical protein